MSQPDTHGEVVMEVTADADTMQTILGILMEAESEGVIEYYECKVVEGSVDL